MGHWDSYRDISVGCNRVLVCINLIATGTDWDSYLARFLHVYFCLFASCPWPILHCMDDSTDDALLADLLDLPVSGKPDPLILARQGATLAEIARHTGQPVGAITEQLVAAGISPDSPAHKLRVFDALHQRAVGMTVSSEAMTRDGPVSLDKQLPPDPAAMTAYLQATMPDRFKHEQPASAVTFVVALPPPSRDAGTWLTDIGRDESGRVVATIPSRPVQG